MRLGLCSHHTAAAWPLALLGSALAAEDVPLPVALEAMIGEIVLSQNPAVIFHLKEETARVVSDPGMLIDLLANSEAWNADMLPRLDAANNWPGAKELWSAVATLHQQAFPESPGARPNVIIGIYLFWCCLCLLYASQGRTSSEGQSQFRSENRQWREASRNEEGSLSPPQRELAWDLARLLLVTCVIHYHSWQFLFPFPAEDDAPKKNIAQWWYVMFMLPGFVFISGVFGGSFSGGTVAKSLCLSVGACFFAALLTIQCHIMVFGLDVVYAYRNSFFCFEFFLSDFWYLWALLGWRLTIPPLFKVGSEWLSVPRSLLLVFALALAFVGRHATADVWGPDAGCALVGIPFANCGMDPAAHQVSSPSPSPAELLTSCDGLLTPSRPLDAAFASLVRRGSLRLIWVQFWYYAPFYALGLLRSSPQEWLSMLQQPAVRAVSAAILAAWYSAHLLFADYLQAKNLSACFFSDSCVACTTFPREVLYSPLSLEALLFDSLDFLQKAALTLSFLSLLAWLSTYLQLRLPRCTELLAEQGSRSLYAYILHCKVLQFAAFNGILSLSDHIKGNY
ncbi:unnamed protein product, partial [Polarella glacialis]